MARDDYADGLQRAMANLYRAERARAEKCIADICDILCGDGDTEQREDALLVRVIRHYQRCDEQQAPLVTSERCEINAALEAAGYHLQAHVDGTFTLQKN